MRRLAWCLLVCSACGGTQHPRAESPDAGAQARSEDPPPLPSDRALGASPTFGDLVAAAVHEDDMRASDSDAGCLLRRTSAGWELAADLSVAVRGLPDAAIDLASRVEASGGRARVLTRLGGYGAPGPLVAVALTTIAGASPRTGALLVLTEDGVYVLPTQGTGDRALLDVPTAATRVASLDVASVFVTAEAGVALDELARLLAALPASLEGRVALAAVLPEDAQAPTELADVPDEAPVCADGLPPLPDDAAVGDLDAASLRASLAALVPSGQACVATSASGLGGLVRVTFRVGDTGHVTAACVREDGIGDATLRACLVASLTTLSFPAPNGGSVDVELPLRLELERDAAHHQRAVCE